jgi:hypothetical protein
MKCIYPDISCAILPFFFLFAASLLSIQASTYEMVSSEFTKICTEFTCPRVGFKITTLVVLSTDCIGSEKQQIPEFF